ncbi:14306_t:CDS:1, partial [Funneliformis caledonium]
FVGATYIADSTATSSAKEDEGWERIREVLKESRGTEESDCNQATPIRIEEVPKLIKEPSV